MQTINTIIALAEPNRFRILELLRERPRSVGEVSDILGLRQPQVTKHLQTLEKAGLAVVYPLGQRRIYALQAAPLQQVQTWINAFEPNWTNRPHEIDQYLAALKREQALAAKNSSWANGRNVTIKRMFTASPETLWRYWTSVTDMKKWWSPDYLTTINVESDPQPGGVIHVDMQDPEGLTHTASGHYTSLHEPEQIGFVMSPIDDDGRPLFESHDTVNFKKVDDEITELTLHVRLEASTAAAATFIAGLEIGWNQTLDKLTRVLDTERREANM